MTGLGGTYCLPSCPGVEYQCFSDVFTDLNEDGNFESMGFEVDLTGSDIRRGRISGELL